MISGALCPGICIFLSFPLNVGAQPGLGTIESDMLAKSLSAQWVCKLSNCSGTNMGLLLDGANVDCQNISF